PGHAGSGRHRAQRGARALHGERESPLRAESDARGSHRRDPRAGARIVRIPGRRRVAARATARRSHVGGGISRTLRPRAAGQAGMDRGGAVHRAWRARVQFRPWRPRAGAPPRRVAAGRKPGARLPRARRVPVVTREAVIAAAAAGTRVLEDAAVRDAVESVLADLDVGRLRVAEKVDGAWRTHAWVKQAILLYFRLRRMETLEVGPFEFRDKIPLKHDLEAQGVRVVPPGVARYGSFLEPGVVLMPGYVNLGAHVGQGTMIDTWATVGSCA